jgi:uncharacterized protein YuzE
MATSSNPRLDTRFGKRPELTKFRCSLYSSRGQGLSALTVIDHLRIVVEADARACRARNPLMEFQLDRDVNALYIKLGTGTVSRTIELTDSIYVDLDSQEAPVGIEFTNADEFIPFLRSNADNADILPQVRQLFRVTAA